MFERIRKLFKKTAQKSYYDAAGLRTVTIKYDHKGRPTFDIEFEFLNIDGEVVSRSTFSEESYYNKARRIEVGEYARMLAGSLRMEARSIVEKQLNAILFTNKSTTSEDEDSKKKDADRSPDTLGSGGGDGSTGSMPEQKRTVVETVAQPKNNTKSRRKVKLISKILRVRRNDIGNIFIYATIDENKGIRLQQSFFHDVKLADIYRRVYSFCKKNKLGLLPTRCQVYRFLLANGFKIVKKDKYLMVEDVSFE